VRGPGFAARRGTAIVRLLLDTGMRRAECTHLKANDIDFEHDVAFSVLGEGHRPRASPFGRKTAQALDRYLRARAGHKEAHREELWLGLWGR
jgi:site-specific recombinase XerD